MPGWVLFDWTYAWNWSPETFIYIFAELCWSQSILTYCIEQNVLCQDSADAASHNDNDES